MDTTGPRAQSMTTETEALQRFYAAINRNDMQAITADFDPRIATDWMGGRFADGFALRDGRITEYVTFEEQANATGRSAFVVAGIGSLSSLSLRFAAAPEESRRSGAFEILGLSGSLSASGAHLHMSVADEQGQVAGGHVGYGNTVRTTAEILLALLEDWHLSRAPDAATGYRELQLRRRAAGESAP